MWDLEGLGGEGREFGEGVRVGYEDGIFMHTISLLCACGKTVTQI